MAATPPLSETEIAKALATLPGWRHEAGALRKNFRFSDFRGAIAFIQEASVDVDRLDHHPTWTNTYNRVDVALTTHDSGNQVTAKDVQVARAIELATSRVRPSLR
jgi:4a-hydroxytetrahydrobiopterin dehydratase